MLKIAVAGNPNVGKSSIFNGLTGLKRHTGNWSGKTVDTFEGVCEIEGQKLTLVDLPGAYSLMHSGDEEETARDFLCFCEHDATLIVCDATALERNLILALQILEISDDAILCVNMIDEARKKCINTDIEKLSKLLGIPVISCNARDKKCLEGVKRAISEFTANKNEQRKAYSVLYPEEIERAISVVSEAIGERRDSRFIAIKLLDSDKAMGEAMQKYMGICPSDDPKLKTALESAIKLLDESGITKQSFSETVSNTVVSCSSKISQEVTTFSCRDYDRRDRRIDRILTNPFTGVPIMLVLLLVVLFITIFGANYPSEGLSWLFTWLEAPFRGLLEAANAPLWFISLLVDGIYRTVTWVVAVMLPPMAIFFPLFTLLEDVGYLPRIAFNLDKSFKRVCACGKQALTMCMGFGCNAVGIIGCRIISSPRERDIAVLTNNFVPCNGRFPTLIVILTMFVAGSGALSSLTSAALVTVAILIGVTATLLASKLLSCTFLKGAPSSFVLELPPYRRPQFGRVIVNSLVERTAFVLLRALAVAAPAGLIIWLMANISVDGSTILAICANALDPVASVFGLDGIILLAFILGFPANEIVLPIMVMAYMNAGVLTEPGNVMMMKELLVQNGWTFTTAICVILFCIMHWPCSTTCITVYKETKSMKKTLLAAALPTAFGLCACFIVNTASVIIVG